MLRDIFRDNLAVTPETASHVKVPQQGFALGKTTGVKTLRAVNPWTLTTWAATIGSPPTKTAPIIYACVKDNLKTRRSGILLWTLIHIRREITSPTTISVNSQLPSWTMKSVGKSKYSGMLAFWPWNSLKLFCTLPSSRHIMTISSSAIGASCMPTTVVTTRLTWPWT